MTSPTKSTDHEPSKSLTLEAFSIAQAVRYGKGPPGIDFLDDSVHEQEVAVTELRSRLPGFERTEYVRALEAGFGESRASPPPSKGENFLYWTVALTFVWAFVPVNLVVKKISGLNEWISLMAYPAACVMASALLLRHRLRSPALFAGLNLIAGISWVMLSIWAASAFASSFWR